MPGALALLRQPPAEQQTAAAVKSSRTSIPASCEQDVFVTGCAHRCFQGSGRRDGRKLIQHCRATLSFADRRRVTARRVGQPVRESVRNALSPILSLGTGIACPFQLLRISRFRAGLHKPRRKRLWLQQVMFVASRFGGIAKSMTSPVAFSQACGQPNRHPATPFHRPSLRHQGVECFGAPDETLPAFGIVLANFSSRRFARAKHRVRNIGYAKSRC